MPAKVVTFQSGPLRGSIGVPGDKSVSHRALIVGAVAGAPLRIENLNPGADVRATRDALALLGVHGHAEGRETVVVPHPLIEPARTLECMNSGSTARMLLGACAGAGIRARFDGDVSLRRRPMEPVAAQLRAFGAKIETSQGRLPVELLGTPEVQTRRFILLAPSAQIKSALLFAGLFANVAVQVDGDRSSRDHTERLLRYLGANIEWDGKSSTLERSSLAGGPIRVPGDFSAAAFFIVAATITPGSTLIIRDVGVNPTRTGLLDALKAMGAAIELRVLREVCGEPVADIWVDARPLRATSIDAQTALRAIDEIPLLAIAASFAVGTTAIAGVTDLRSKESDRISAIERLLNAVGIDGAYERGSLRIHGGKPVSRAQILQTHDDHRIAMAAAVLASAAGPLAVDSDESIAVSFPGFGRALESLREP